jgi:hypothetical protein
MFAVLMIFLAATDLDAPASCSREIAFGQSGACLKRPGSLGKFSGTLLAEPKGETDSAGFGRDQNNTDVHSG